MLATTQLHFNMEDRDFSKEDRDILRVKTLAEYLEDKPEKHESHDPGPTRRSMIRSRMITRTRARMRRTMPGAWRSI